MITTSVAVFRDRKKEILIISEWTDSYGIHRQSKKYKKILSQYTERELGEAILYMIEISKRNEQEEFDMKQLNDPEREKEWNAFQKKYENVSVVLLDTGEWRLTRMLKQKGHSYGINKDDVDKYVRRYSTPLTVQELGKEVLHMFALKYGIPQLIRRMEFPKYRKHC